MLFRTLPQPQAIAFAPIDSGGTGIRDTRPAGSAMNAMDPARALILIDRNTLGRDCLARSLYSARVASSVAAFATVAELLAAAPGTSNLAVLVQRGGGGSVSVLRWDVERLRSFDSAMPIVLVSDDEDPESILRALDLGVAGYIPSSLGIDIAFEAMRLVMAGGTFVPANSLFDYRRAARIDTAPPSVPAALFTARQADVIRLLRQGMSNKSIAGALNMRESTVKVHVRKIMKVIHARNRTEIAVRLANLDGDLDEH